MFPIQDKNISSTVNSVFLRPLPLVYLALLVIFLHGCCALNMRENDISFTKEFHLPKVTELIHPATDNMVVEQWEPVVFVVWVEITPIGDISDLGYTEGNSVEPVLSDFRSKSILSALNAVSQWKFTPMVVDGEAIFSQSRFLFSVSKNNNTIKWRVKRFKVSYTRSGKPTEIPLDEVIIH